MKILSHVYGPPLVGATTASVFLLSTNHSWTAIGVGWATGTIGGIVMTWLIHKWCGRPLDQITFFDKDLDWLDDDLTDMQTRWQPGSPEYEDHFG